MGKTGKVNKDGYLDEQKYNSPFARRLRELLEEKKKSQKKSQRDLAEVLGMTKQSVQAYTTGESVPTITTLEKISDYFMVSSEYLLGRSNVRARNLSTTSISNVTGLSEEAIENLRSFNKAVDIRSPLPLINALLENPEALLIISTIQDSLFEVVEIVSKKASKR